MRLLVLEAVPQYGGGCEAVSLELTKELARRGHEMHLAYDTDGDMLPEYRRHVREVWQASLSLFGWRELGASVSAVRRIGRYCQEHQIDAIFSSHLGYLRSLALVKIRYGVESVYHLGLPLHKPQRSVRWSMKHIAAGVAPSEHSAEVWRDSGWPSERLHVVRNWVDAQRFAPAADVATLRRSLGLDPTAPTIVYVGRLTHEKGIDTLLAAFAGVLRTLPAAQLVLIGAATEEYEDRLQQTLQTHTLADHVKAVGVVDHPEHYLAAADVAVVPPEWREPFGLMLIEAMACGKLTITSDVGVLPQNIGPENRDLVFPAGNVPELERRLIHWLERPDEAQQRGLALRERAVREFTPPSSIDAYERLLAAAAHPTSEDAGK